MLACLFSVFTSLAFAAQVHTVKLQGTVQATTCEALGRTDGILLTDKTYLRFHPATFTEGTQLLPGDKIEATGQEIFSKPNRVFVRLLIKKAGETIVDDVPIVSNAEAAPIITSSLSAQADSKFVYRATARVLAVGGLPGQQGDRLILDSGVTLEIPHGTSIDASERLLGSSVSVVGAATSGSGGHFVLAMSIQAQSGAELLKSRDKDSKWTLTQGVVKTIKTDAKGKIESFLLNDGRTVVLPVAIFPFPPADELVPGLSIELSGLVYEKSIESRLLIALSNNSVIDTDVGVVIRHGRR